MSTEHQQYSVDNQCDVMREYASRHAMEIVRVYADEGKSGLRLSGRDSLKRLIADVSSPTRDFSAILVYDVSRWGRFQDVDESAYYEYACRRAGVDVHYCAEQFANDGSPVSTIVKGIKRAMAAEYSRELSAKVFRGQSRLVQLGFRQGGRVGYGLRRVLVDQEGNVKGLLSEGEHKSIATDRVVLQPGPPEELAIIRWMFLQFAVERRTEPQIAETLNAEEIVAHSGGPWTRAMVHYVLTNENYIGNNVYNRTSCKLRKKRVHNTPDMYVRANGVFERIVDLDLFARAQEIMAERWRKRPDAELVKGLKQLLQRHRHLSVRIINAYDKGPSASTYTRRFGNLLPAYRMAGYVPRRDFAYLEINRQLRKLHPQVVLQIRTGMVAQGAVVTYDEEADLLTVNSEFTVSAVIARCLQTRCGACRWVVRLDTRLKSDITVAVRMDHDNIGPMDYYLLPTTDMPGEELRLGETNGLLVDRYKFQDLDYLARMARRAHIQEVI